MSKNSILLSSFEFTKSALFLCLAGSTSVFAEQEQPKLTVGLSVAADYQAYKGHRIEYSVLPDFFYDNDRIYAEGDEAGVYLLNDDENELRLNAYYDGSSYRPSGPLHELDKRQWSVMMGASYMHITPFGGFKLQVGQDVLGRHNGMVSRLAYLAEFKEGPWSVYPEFGVQWNNAKYNQYYFGVSAEESARSGIDPYTAQNSVQPYASMVIDYRMNKHWDFFTVFDFNYLSNQQYRSPMISSRYEFEPRIGLNYTF